MGFGGSLLRLVQRLLNLKCYLALLIVFNVLLSVALSKLKSLVWLTKTTSLGVLHCIEESLSVVFGSKHLARSNLAQLTE